MKGNGKLRYISDEIAGYRRKKHGRGYIYYNPQGEKIGKEELEERLNELRIPPMWDEVWISPFKNGHLQVTGYDEKGRKQYLYHEEWIAFRNANKYHKLLEFAKKLPLIRERIYKDLKQPDWKKEKVLALVIFVLDEYFIRIGNQAYLNENETYGLTTLRRKHLTIEGKEAVLSYKAKSGKEREINIEHKQLVKLIKECSELPGYELFCYQESGRSNPVDSEDVNDYLKEIAGEEFSSKDFRTWGGTVTAVEEFENAVNDVEENPKRNLLTALVERVAARLGNTPAVCREYYIHPAVLEAAEDGSLKQIISRSRARQTHKSGLTKYEKISLKLLKEYDREHLIEPVFEGEKVI